MRDDPLDSSDAQDKSFSPESLAEAQWRRGLWQQEGDTLSKPPDSGLERFGDPERLKEFWEYQDNSFDCGIYSQKDIFEAQGIHVSAEELRQIGENKNPPAYTRHLGTFEIGFAFEKAGLGKTDYQQDAFDPSAEANAARDLKNELTANHGVIAAVDSGVLWGEKSGGHALWVTGIDVQDGKITQVYANDSGRADGNMATYPGKTFMYAWRMRNYEMVATKTTFPQ